MPLHQASHQIAQTGLVQLGGHERQDRGPVHQDQQGEPRAPGRRPPARGHPRDDPAEPGRGDDREGKDGRRVVAWLVPDEVGQHRGRQPNPGQPQHRRARPAEREGEHRRERPQEQPQRGDPLEQLRAGGYRVRQQQYPQLRAAQVVEHTRVQRQRPRADRHRPAQYRSRMESGVTSHEEPENEARELQRHRHPAEHARTECERGRREQQPLAPPGARPEGAEKRPAPQGREQQRGRFRKQLVREVQRDGEKSSTRAARRAPRSSSSSRYTPSAAATVASMISAYSASSTRSAP